MGVSSVFGFLRKGLRRKKRSDADELQELLNTGVDSDAEFFQNPSAEESLSGKDIDGDDYSESATIASPDDSNELERRFSGNSVVANNVTPFEWAKSVIVKSVRQKMVKTSSYFLVFGVFFPAVVVVAAVVGMFYVDGMSKELSKRVENAGKKVGEYEAVEKNLSIYQDYSILPHEIPVHTQFSILTFLCLKNGIYIQDIKYHKHIQPEIEAIVRESFAIESGKTLPKVSIAGTWTITGILSPNVTAEADTNWILDLNKQATALFRKGSAFSTYTQSLSRGMSGQVRNALSFAVIVWR